MDAVAQNESLAEKPLEAESGLSTPTILVVSDSLGETASDVALAAAAQFDRGIVHIERLPKVIDAQQVESRVRQLTSGARDGGLLIFHTIADAALRDSINALASELEVGCVDLLGPALGAISSLIGREPRGQAGVIRRTDERYFKRIEAMEFFVSHDDGRNPEELTQADIVLVGVSRTSKTPLSMYLSFHGYKVANIPLAKGVEPPKELFDVEPFRIFGLISTPEVLSTIRNERLGSLEAKAVAGSYSDPMCIEDELKEARALMRRLGCIVIHTDGRAVEETSQIIIGYFTSAEAAREKRRALQG